MARLRPRFRCLSAVVGPTLATSSRTAYETERLHGLTASASRRNQSSVSVSAVPPPCAWQSQRETAAAWQPACLHGVWLSDTLWGGWMNGVAARDVVREPIDRRRRPRWRRAVRRGGRGGGGKGRGVGLVEHDRT